MTARIIKANSPRPTSSSEAFNLVDLEQAGADIVSAARREAEEIVRHARAEAVLIREQTFADGERAGHAEGIRNANEKVTRRAEEIANEKIAAQLSTALPALLNAASSLQAERDKWLIRWENTAVQLSVAIAEKLIHRQLVSRPDIASEMITDALQLAAGQPQLIVHLHPDDLAAWGDKASQIVQSFTSCGDATLVPDLTTTRGGCRIETRHGEVDARLETMLRRIAEELVDS